MRSTFWAALVLAVGLAAIFSFERTHAQSPSPNNEAPRLVFQHPADGAVVNEPLFVIQVCFANPINVRDLHLGGDFHFSLADSEGRGLGLRIVFQPDGYGAAIYPGDPPGEPTGEWAFGWRVTSPDGRQASEGESTFTVDPDGEEPPQATPPSCIGELGTATPPSNQTPPVSGIGTPGVSTAGSSPSGDSSTPNSTEGPDDGDGGSDLLIVLLAIGGVAIVVVLAIGFLVRRASRGSQRSAGGDSSDES